MLPWIADETVTRLRAQDGTNGYSTTAVPNWKLPPNEVLIEGCSVQPETGQEILDGRTVIVTRQRWLGPYDPEVKGSDRIRHNGVTYKVAGSVERWRDPIGAGLDYQTCLLEALS